MIHKANCFVVVFLIVLSIVNPLLSSVINTFPEREESFVDVSILCGDSPIIRPGSSSRGLKTNFLSDETSINSEFKKGFNSRFNLKESNDTHLWVQDPTNQTDGYWIGIGSSYQELNGSRGQTFRHWYNATENTFTYSSDYLVNKSGVIDGTDWITEEEYPYRFILRLTNGSIRTFETPEEISNYIFLIDNSTIWGVGYESFEGVIGFYLNFQDTTWGHGQYLYYPRLKDGQLPPYNQPLYAIYPHLYARIAETWYDKILNDRSLYTESYQNPRNTIQFYNNSNEFGLYFSTPNITIQGFSFNFIHGFKYNFADNLYHLITRFECVDRDFDDIGMAYEIMSSPQSDNTPHQPNRFRISNETYQIEVGIADAWSAGEYFADFYSQIEIVSQNNESFVFTFSDMEKAGFTQKYLNLHDQSFSDGSNRKTLRAGMYGYGSYIQGTVIEIDPDVSSIYPTDNYDLTRQTVTNPLYSTGSTTQMVGRFHDGQDQYQYEAFTCWNTGIEYAITEIEDGTADMQVYVTSNLVESDEGVSTRVYNIHDTTDGGGIDTSLEDSTDWDYNINQLQSATLINPSTGAYQQFDTSKTETLLEYWADQRYSTENYISFRFEHYLTDNGEYDYISWRESQYTGTTYDPKLSFTYYVAAPVSSFLNDGDNVYAGLEETSVQTRHSSDYGYTHINEAYLWIGVGGSVWDIQLKHVIESSTSIVSGSEYVISVSDCTEGGAGNNMDLTWKFTLDWDYDKDESELDYKTNAKDDDGQSGTEVEDLDTGALFETELIVYSMSITLSDSAYSQDGNTALTSGEWFRGGVGIKATGVVTYEGTADVYPPITATDVQLYADNAASTLTDCGEDYDDDTLGSSGEYDTSTAVGYYTTVSDSGLDATFEIDCQLADFVSGASEGDGGVSSLVVKRDNQVPIATSYTHTDSNSGVGYDPNNGYDDDLVADYTINNPSDQSGSGLHDTPYRYNWLGGGYGSYSSDTTPAITVTDGDYGDSDLQIRDKVGNVATIDGEDITIDDDAPIGFTVTWSRHTGHPMYSAYISGSTIFYDSGNDDYFGFTVNTGGTIQNSGYWKTMFDINSVIDPTTTDTSGLPDSDNQYYLSAGSGTFIVRLVNNAGNWQEWSYTATADNINPTLTDAMSDYSEGGDTGEMFGKTSTDTFYFSNSFDTDGTATFTATGTDGSSGAYGIDFGSWGGDDPSLDTSSPYQGQYTVNNADSTGSITITIYDNVGNSASGSITCTEDTNAPSISTTGESEDSDYLYSGYGTVKQGFYGSQMTSGQSYAVSGTASDGSSGMASVDDDTAFGDNPSNSGTATAWQFVYIIDTADDGDITVTYTGSDHVGNSNTDVYTFYEDNTAPTGYSLALTPDDATIGYQPNTGYYDDDSVDVEAIGSITEGESGLSPTPYSFQRNSEGWSSYQSSDLYIFTSTTDGSHTLYVKVRDNVFNEGSSQSTNVIVDTDNPTGFSTTWSRHTGWSDSYHAYLSGSTLYYNNLENDYFGVQVNDDGSIQNSGYWKIRWDINSVFETWEDDTDPLPESKDFYYYDDTGTNFVIRLINNAGNYQSFEFTGIVDVTKPNSYALSLDSLYHAPGEDVMIYGSTTDDLSGLLSSDCYEWWVNPARDYGTLWTSTGQYTWSGIADLYPIFYAAAWDNVGNWRNASTVMGSFFSVIIITYPQPEIKEIEVTEYYDLEDVYYEDLPLKIASTESEEDESKKEIVSETEIQIPKEIFYDERQDTTPEPNNEIDRIGESLNVTTIIGNIGTGWVLSSILLLIPTILILGKYRKKS